MQDFNYELTNTLWEGSWAVLIWYWPGSAEWILLADWGQSTQWCKVVHDVIHFNSLGPSGWSVHQERSNLKFLKPMYDNEPIITSLAVHQQTETPLVKIIACHVFGDKPLQEPMMMYCHYLILSNKFHWNLNWNWQIFCQEIAFENVVCKMLTILFWP